MSAIIPWNDPGGTPCCCETPCDYSAPSSGWASLELTPQQYALLYAGGTFAVSASANIFVEVTRLCTRTTLNASATVDSSWSSVAEQCSNFQNTVSGTVVAESCNVAGEIIQTPCSLSFSGFSCTNVSREARLQYVLFNSQSPLSFATGMHARADVVVGRGGTGTWGAVNIQLSGSKATRTVIASSPPVNAASTWGSAQNITINTDAGNIVIPSFDASLRGASGASGITITDHAIAWSAGPTFTFSASAP